MQHHPEGGGWECSTTQKEEDGKTAPPTRRVEEISITQKLGRQRRASGNVPCLCRALGVQFMELAAKNIELRQRRATVEAVGTATPTPQQVLMPSVIDTRFLEQPVAFYGDRTKWTDWACTCRAYASAGNTRMVVSMEQVQECDRPVGIAHSAK